MSRRGGTNQWNQRLLCLLGYTRWRTAEHCWTTRCWSMYHPHPLGVWSSCSPLLVPRDSRDRISQPQLTTECEHDAPLNRLHLTLRTCRGQQGEHPASVKAEFKPPGEQDFTLLKHPASLAAPEVLFYSRTWPPCARKARNPGIVIKTIITQQEWLTLYILKLDIQVQARYNTLKFQYEKGFFVHGTVNSLNPRNRLRLKKIPFVPQLPPSLLNLQCLWDCLAAITQIQKSPPSPIKLQQQWSHSAPGVRKQCCSGNFRASPPVAFTVFWSPEPKCHTSLHSQRALGAHTC